MYFKPRGSAITFEGGVPCAVFNQIVAIVRTRLDLIPCHSENLSHRNRILSTGWSACVDGDALLFSGSRETARGSCRFVICIEEWPVLLLKSCRCSSGASRWPLGLPQVGEVGSRFVGRIESESSSSPCRESRREQPHCMTREENPFVRLCGARHLMPVDL